MKLFIILYGTDVCDTGLYEHFFLLSILKIGVIIDSVHRLGNLTSEISLS